jgi:hypothetical protein
MIVKKISVVFIIITLIITSVGVIINNKDVHATPDSEDITFDYQLIHDVTQYLSERITKSYDIKNGSLAKGRDFGSQGERDAAEYIALKMGEFDFYDLNYSALSYRQKIKDASKIPEDAEHEIRENFISRLLDDLRAKDFFLSTDLEKLEITIQTLWKFKRKKNEKIELNLIYKQ